MSPAPEYKVVVNHEAAGRYGLPVPELVQGLEAAQGGTVVGRVLEGDRFVPELLRLDEQSRAPERLARFTLRHLPDGTPIRLSDVADLYESEGPYEIQREDGERRLAVELNSAARRMFWLSLLAVLGISAVVYANFRSIILTVQILLNLPFALIGGVFALLVTGTPLSVASLVGFVALAGIAARNGILMISHFEHLMRVEGEPFSVATIIRGALERLTPVLMTAGTAILLPWGRSPRAPWTSKRISNVRCNTRRPHFRSKPTAVTAPTVTPSIRSGRSWEPDCAFVFRCMRPGTARRNWMPAAEESKPCGSKRSRNCANSAWNCTSGTPASNAIVSL